VRGPGQDFIFPLWGARSLGLSSSSMAMSGAITGLGGGRSGRDRGGWPRGHDHRFLVFLLFLCRRSPQLPRQSTQPIRIVQNRLRHRIKRDVEVMAQ
jgi:hypothetical protein